MPRGKAKKAKGDRKADERGDRLKETVKNLRKELKKMNEHLDAAEEAKKKGKAAKDKKDKKRSLKEIEKHLRRARNAKKRFINKLPGIILGFPFSRWYHDLEDVDYYIDSVLYQIGNDLTPVGQGENFEYINIMIDFAKKQKAQLEKLLGE